MAEHRTARPSVIGDGLGHRYGEGPWLFRAVNVNLTGGITALTGPSGTGKSTLLAILAGSNEPTEGTVRRSGILAVTSIAQSAHGVAGRTVLDHITLPYLAVGLTRAEAEERARPIAAQFGIDHLLAAPYRQLSGGEAQRLMLARASAQENELILADEPTANLDARNARSVIDVLGGLAAGGALVVIATHDPLAQQACDTVIDLASFAREDTSPGQLGPSGATS